ncbi:MAG TPA: LysM peptidoglycan-binding domain-containing protein [Candidatus Polarisedimenticolia bacterium]|nr:LysM peptidoglycan-binding domain-containing protein [Candidatus Polarisedimenticolia bacterium]
MGRSTKSILASAAALLLASGLVGPAPVVGQDGPAKADGAGIAVSGDPAAGDTAEKPAAGTERSPRRQRALQPGSTLPPKHLKRVGDHWTPYDPPDPESFPPDASLHIIVPGDTLWDLADLAFGNPYLWPQIWNENRYILDSHWIYPGDPLLLPARPTVVSEVVPQGQAGAPPTAEAAPPEPSPEPVQEPLTAEAPAAETPAAETPAAPAEIPKAPTEAHAPRTVPKIVPLADDSDIRCSGYIAQHDEKPDYFIANQEEEGKVGLTEGDIIYLNRGRDNGHVEPGTQYSIVVREGDVTHPVTHNRVGIYYSRIGTVTVLAAQDRTAIGEISMACDMILTGYDLVPLRVIKQPARKTPPFSRLNIASSGKATGYIVHVKDAIGRVGAGHIVDVDLGYDDGLAPGDYLTVFIPNQPYDKYRKVGYDYQWGNERYQTPALRVDHHNAYPNKVVGQLVILTTEKHTATAKVLNSAREIFVGNQVEVE